MIEIYSVRDELEEESFSGLYRGTASMILEGSKIIEIGFSFSFSKPTPGLPNNIIAEKASVVFFRLEESGIKRSYGYMDMNFPDWRNKFSEELRGDKEFQRICRENEPQFDGALS